MTISGGAGGYSIVTELEAWTAGGTASNLPPTVSLSTDDTQYTAPASIELTAAAGDQDGSVTKVEYFANGLKIGETLSGSMIWADVPQGSYALTAVATDDDGASSTSDAVNVTVTGGGTAMVNVAAAANGGVASASSSLSSGYSASAVIDGERSAPWSSGGGWADADRYSFPDWIQVDFDGVHAISEIDVITLQDNYNSPQAPTEALTFSQWGITDFEVQYWTGSGWATVPGGAVAGNNRVWRRFTFPAVNTERIRVTISGGAGGYSIVTELEAWAAGG